MCLLPSQGDERWLFLPVLAVALDAVSVGEGGFDYDESGQEADEAHERHKDVRGGEARPGVYHWRFCR